MSKYQKPALDAINHFHTFFKEVPTSHKKGLYFQSSVWSETPQLEIKTRTAISKNALFQTNQNKNIFIRLNSINIEHYNAF